MYSNLKPTFSVIVYENREKLVEIPIQNLEEFVDVIDKVFIIIKFYKIRIKKNRILKELCFLFNYIADDDPSPN